MSPSQKSTPTVLIVDDDEDIRHAVRLVLDRYEVVEASNAAEAVEAIARQTPRFILLDERMPGKTGAEAAEDLRAGAPGARVIAFGAMTEKTPPWADAHLSKIDLLALPELLSSFS